MLTITIEELINENGSVNTSKSRIIINDVIEDFGFAYPVYQSHKFNIELTKLEAIDEILRSSFGELEATVAICRFERVTSNFKYIMFIRFENNSYNIHTPLVDVRVIPDTENWRQPYSVRQLIHKMKETSDFEISDNIVFYNWQDELGTVFGTSTPIDDLSQQIGPLVNRALMYTEELIAKSISQLGV